MTRPDLKEAATAATLLVVCDYDGTLAPIVDDPASAHAEEAALEALRVLARLPNTAVAVISGRTVDELVRFVDDVPGVILVGGHGADWGEAHQNPDASELASLLLSVASEYPGALVELKPTGVAFHYRQVDPDRSDDAVEAALRAASSRATRVLHGKLVIEFATSAADKGSAVKRLRRQLSPDVIVFIGDDVTDEDAFAALDRDDISVKVGEGDTIATFRLAEQTDVAGLLRELGDLRNST